MRVLLCHQAVDDSGNHTEQDTLIQAEEIRAALVRLGNSCELFPVTLDLAKLQARLRVDPGIVVFNLVESLGGSDSLMHLATEIYEQCGVPYTGARGLSIRRTNHKHLAKREMRVAGLPTAEWFGPRIDLEADRERFQPGRYILKATSEHASIGMTDDAIVDVDSLIELDRFLQRFQQKLGIPCFAEQFIEGRELNLSLLSMEDDAARCIVMPPAEIDFSELPKDRLAIVGYNAKWVEDSIEYQATPRTFNFSANDHDMLASAKFFAQKAWELFGMTGYVRVDFRVDRAGRPLILEINANPCATTYGGFIAACDQGGLDYDQVIRRILATAH